MLRRLELRTPDPGEDILDPCSARLNHPDPLRWAEQGRRATRNTGSQLDADQGSRSDAV